MNEAAVLDRSAWLFAADGPLSEAAVAELCADPRFPEAIRTLTSGILALYRGNRFLNALINDRGRMIIGYLALYLHEGTAPDGRGSGFSVGQLKALCAAAGMASPGRTGAMVAMMRMAGYIASAPSPDDRRRHILVPTEKLRLAHRDRWTCVAETVRVVNPVRPMPSRSATRSSRQPMCGARPATSSMDFASSMSRRNCNCSSIAMPE